MGLESIDWDPRATVGVVIASRGYPDAYEKGKRITGLERVTGEDQKIFHAGTRLKNGEVLSDGGRVLCAVGIGDTVGAAQRRAYDAVSKVGWDGAFSRNGHRLPRRRAGASGAFN